MLLAASTASATAIAVVITTSGTAVSAAAVTAITVTAAAIADLRFCFVDNQGAAHVFLTIQSFDGSVHAICRLHGDKSKSSGTTGVAIRGHKYFRYFTMSAEQISQVFFSCIKGQIPYIHFCVHIFIRQAF